jgi:predicted DCC family thiol-disulfide oxidoreductase YuxK
MGGDRTLLLYDGDCGFCTWSVARILRWSRGRLEAAPIQGERAAVALAGMDPAQRMRSWHVVLADGTVHSAAAAVPYLLEVRPGTAFLAPAARFLRWPIEGVYRLVARNRRHLSRMLGKEACSLDPTGPAARGPVPPK